MKTLTLTLTNRGECVLLVTACNLYQKQHPEFQPKPMVDALWNNKSFPTTEKYVTFELDDKTAESVPLALVEYGKQYKYTVRLTSMVLFHYLSAYLITTP